jgi:hypothetical protein
MPPLRLSLAGRHRGQRRYATDERRRRLALSWLAKHPNGRTHREAVRDDTIGSTRHGKLPRIRRPICLVSCNGTPAVLHDVALLRLRGCLLAPGCSVCVVWRGRDKVPSDEAADAEHHQLRKIHGGAAIPIHSRSREAGARRTGTAWTDGRCGSSILGPVRAAETSTLAVQAACFLLARHDISHTSYTHIFYNISTGPM